MDAARTLMPHGQAQFARAVVRPAGQAELAVALGVATVGALGLGGWLAYKAFSAHQPSMQQQPIVATPQTISLMQAQLQWMGTHPPPSGTVLPLMPTPMSYAPSLTPAALAAYAAVSPSGQIDAPTLAAYAYVYAMVPASERATIDQLNDPEVTLTAVDNLYGYYMLLFPSTNAAPKLDSISAAGRPLLPHGQGQFAAPPIAPAGQIAEFVAGAVVVGGLAFASWLAYKQFGTYQPSFQQSDLVTPQTIALMQAQLRWMGTHPFTMSSLRPDSNVTTFSPSALAAYAAVTPTGQFDAATVAALPYVLLWGLSDTNVNSETQPTATMQRDPTPVVQTGLATTSGQQGLIGDVNILYQQWVDASNSPTPMDGLPKPAGAVRPLLPFGQAQFVRSIVRPAGQALPVGAPPGSFGVDDFGQCVDASGNVLDPSGASLGSGNVARTGAATCGVPVAGTVAPTVVLPVTPGTPAVPVTPSGITPATVPSGLPNGIVQQLGSSVTPVFVVTVLGVVLAVGGLAFYLTRTAPAPAPAPVRAARAGRNYATRARSS